MGDKKIDEFLDFSKKDTKNNKGALKPESAAPLPRKTKNQSRKVKKGRFGVFIACILILLICVVVISKGFFKTKESIIGTWDYDSTTTYRFDEGGKGALVLPSSSYEFGYEIKDDTLSIDFADEKARDGVYTFTLDGNKLTMKRSGEDRVYEFIKKE